MSEIVLRPYAIRPTRGESDNIFFPSEAFEYPIYPSIAQRFVERVLVGHSGFTGMFLIKQQPDGIFLGMVFRKPFSEELAVFEVAYCADLHVR